MVTRSVAARRSGESIRQQRSMSRFVKCELVNSMERVPIPTRVAQAESVGGAPEGQETAVWLDCADEALKELADILLYNELLWCWEELDHEIEEALGEVSEEAVLGEAPAVRSGLLEVGIVVLGGDMR
jgi:hypothetical protein